MAMLSAVIPICKILRVNSEVIPALSASKTLVENKIDGWIYCTMRNFIIPLLVLYRIARMSEE
jgi:hypothetical protein